MLGPSLVNCIGNFDELFTYAVPSPNIELQAMFIMVPLDIKFFFRFVLQGLSHFISFAARRDTLTKHAAFWNKRKVEYLAASLAKQYVKVTLCCLFNIMLNR